MTISARGRPVTDRAVLPVARLLVRLGATANGLTLAGMVIVVGGATIAASGYLRSGALIIGVGAILDAFDGAVARLRASQGPYGSFLDSVCDRVSDAAVLGAIVWLVRDEPATFVAALVALVGALLTSYIRAKAESLGWSGDTGLVERPERLMIAGPALLIGMPQIAAWLLAVGALVTIAQRLVAVRRQARASAGAERA